MTSSATNKANSAGRRPFPPLRRGGENPVRVFTQPA